MEEWKKINNEYAVSNLGRVKRIKNGKTIYLNAEVLKKGYLRVSLWENGKRNRVLVHRLVASLFIPNKNIFKTQVDHINCNTSDNRVENLRWVTPKENVQHSIELNRFMTDKRKKSQAKKKLTEETRKKISESKKGNVPWNKGKNGMQLHSEEWKKQASERMKKYNEKNKKKIICIETNMVYNSISEASKLLNISQGNISMCLNSKRSLAGGFHWKYIS